MRSYVKILLILLSFILLNLFSWLIFANSFSKLFFADPNPGFGDTSYYVGIARDGYTDESEWAYYPLYPLLIKFSNDVISHYLSPISLERTSVILSILLFLVSIPLTLNLFEKLVKNYILFFALYLFNPMIIFHFLGYTESLFSLILVTFLLSFYMRSNTLRIFLAILASFLLVVSRPVFIQFVFSIVFALVIVYFANKEEFKNFFLFVCASVLTSIVGFLSFLGYAYLKISDPLKPFHVQSLWSKKIGFYFNNLWANGTTWDLIALYLGIFLFIFLVLQLFKSLTSSDFEVRRRLVYTKNFVFWFSILFFLSHVAIVFFTQNGDLRSLSRYIFSIPTTFIALGIIYDSYESKIIKFVSYSFLVLSIVSLIYWWYMYSNTLWIG